MKTIFRVILALMTLITLSTAQAADPISTIQNDGTGQCITIANPLTLAPCDGMPHQNYSFGLPGAIYGANNYVATPGAHCLNGSFDDNGSASMGTCAQLNGYWWRARKKIIMSGGTDCLAAVGSAVEMQLCDPTAVNQMWTLSSAVAADWPINGRTQMSSKATNLCLQALGAQTGWPHPGQPSLGVANCQEYMNEFLTFTLTGTIVLEGACLTDSGGGAAGDPVALQVCDGSLSQQWLRSGDSILSTNSQLCIGISGDSAAIGAPIQLQTCSSDPYQQWDFGNLITEWPPAPSVPSTAVDGATLTPQQVNAVVDWIQAETSISTTPFCYKTSSYDRGIGIAPSCGSGLQMDASLCYNQCREGYHGVGPVCWTDQSLTYNPGTHCISRDLLGTCWATAMNSCRDGYTGDQIATCYINKASYGRGAGTVPNSCNSNRQMQAGLCYLNPRAGYGCALTVCTQNCAAGTTDCGIGACASDANNCSSNLLNMVISPLKVLAFIVGGPEMIAFTDAVYVLKIASTANMTYKGEIALQDAVRGFMARGETDLANNSTEEVAEAVAAGYVLDSPNYKFIAREWAARLMLSSIAEAEKGATFLGKILITSMDPTGVAATINAFAKPPCAQHTKMPQY